MPSDPPPFHLTPRDRYILSLSDDQFQPHSWAELNAIIGGPRPLRWNYQQPRS